MQPKPLLLLIIVLLCFSHKSNGQDSSVVDKLISFPDKLLAKIQKKSQSTEANLTNQTEKYLKHLAKQEQKLQSKLQKTDSLKAKELFGKSQEEYQLLLKEINNPTARISKFSTFYSGHLDSMQTALSFLNQSKLTNNINGGNQQLQSLLKSYQGLQGKFNQTEIIRKYLDQRKSFLKEQLQNSGLAKEFRKYQQELYYYKSQLEEYRNAIANPEKIESKLIQLANAFPGFKDFFGRYSQVASLFLSPSNNSLSSAGIAIPGLQTRAGVQDLIQTQVASGGPNAQDMLQQNLDAAQSQLDQLKDRISRLGNSGSDMEMPDFKPNRQKTKPFLQRLELGTNIQTIRGNNYFPTTSDIALSVGYKLNDKNIVGVGASYKMGWGSGFQHIALSSQGLGIRSFLDMKLKGSFYASGGFEYNYQQAFSSLQQLYGFSNWQSSGLLGVSKIIAVKTKVFKNTKVQLLWDFLSYQQIPITQPLKFRIGYSF